MLIYEIEADAVVVPAAADVVSIADRRVVVAYGNAFLSFTSVEGSNSS